MLDDIREVIRKNLPSEVGDRLREQLARAETLKLEVERKDREILDLRAAANGLNATISSLSEKLKLAGDLDKREKEVRGRENVLDVTEANARASSAERALAEVTGLARIVFSNPRLVTRVDESRMVPMPNPSGGYISQQQETKSTTRTEEVNPPGN